MCSVGSLSCLPNSPVHSTVIIRCCTIQSAQRAPRLCSLQATVTLNTSNSGLFFTCSSQFCSTDYIIRQLIGLVPHQQSSTIQFSFALFRFLFSCFIVIFVLFCWGSMFKGVFSELSTLSQCPMFHFLLFISICLPALYCKIILQLPSCPIFICLISVTGIH